MSREFQGRLKKRLVRAGLSLSLEFATQLEQYYGLLSRWNQKINLTALPLEGFPDATLDRLIVEPLVAARHAGRVNVLLDIGSGGGSPAIPMKVAMPHATIVMIESKARKTAFLREVVRELDLSATQVETARLEELLSRPELHEAADVLTMRAVRVEARVLTTAQAFVKPGGAILLFRGSSGPDVPTELTPPLQWQATFPLVESLHSRLVVIRKGGVGLHARIVKPG